MEQIKIRVLNTIGVAIGALDAEPIAVIARPTSELGGRPVSPLTGGTSGALSRYLDFMDGRLAKGEANHPFR